MWCIKMHGVGVAHISSSVGQSCTSCVHVYFCVLLLFRSRHISPLTGWFSAFQACLSSAEWTPATTFRLVFFKVWLNTPPGQHRSGLKWNKKQNKKNKNRQHVQLHIETPLRNQQKKKSLVYIYILESYTQAC